MPRDEGPVPIADDFARVLANIRRHRGLTAPPELDLKSVREMEAAFVGPLPDELLAVWAALGRSLGSIDELTRTVGEFYRGMEMRDWRRDSGFRHVAFDEYNEEGPLVTPLDGSGRIEWWFLRKASGSPPAFVVEGERPFVSYCRWKWGAAGLDLDAAVEPIAPRLVLAAAKMKTERRVRHAVFGEGRVLEELAPDKLLVDFGANGVKKLLARVLVAID